MGPEIWNGLHRLRSHLRQSKPERIGKHQVAVPDRFFKVVLINNRKNPIAMGFIFPNAAHHQKLENT